MFFLSFIKIENIQYISVKINEYFKKIFKILKGQSEAVKKDSQHNDQKVKKDSQHNDQKVKKDSQHNDQKEEQLSQNTTQKSND